MANNTIYNIKFPDRDGGGNLETIEIKNNLVLIGSNGSGKTRLGVFIEEYNNSLEQIVHRISAQKALNFPEYSEIKNLSEAQNELLFGSRKQGNKSTSRWGQQPATHLLNDYSKLITLLFAKSAERDRKYTLAAKENANYRAVPSAPIDDIIDLWNSLMPHRNIAFDDGKVIASKMGVDPYLGNEMSDGERVMLYLMGQCLCAPENSIIIIDEPVVSG